MKEIFEFKTDSTVWQAGVDDYGIMQHIWYGPDTGMDMSYLQKWHDTGFSGQIDEAGNDRSYSLDTRMTEVPAEGMGDYRISSLAIRNPDGSVISDLRFDRIEKTAKKPLAGLPYAFSEDEQYDLHLKDAKNGLEVIVHTSVFADCDVLVRSMTLINHGEAPLVIETADSGSLDLGNLDVDLIHFYGRHNMEREVERTRVLRGITEISSARGSSSHQHNPAVILAERNATETHGACWGVMLLYSGNFAIRLEKDQHEQIRISAGINPDTFEWLLEPEESFQTPEVAFSFSEEGLGQLSRNYHRFIRSHVMRSPLAKKPKPVLINNWEATYFDFTKEKLLEIAREAAALGVNLFVLDDGWFGNRNSDREGLGDWTVNEEKIGNLDELIDGIHKEGMQFGIWIEPEMVSEQSELYRQHPEWVIRIPGRSPQRSRYQLVLDFSNPEVVDYIHEKISAILRNHEISYVKWDMNRSLSDWYSPVLPASRQKEMAHRYTLGVYDLADRLTSEFDQILFEGCSGGGGRFDAGMLFYTPQIWTSDDTDARERTKIQYGTSFFYPVSSMGAHVSAVPNHQTGRTTSLGARGTVAMAGTFGYELDPSKLSEEEKEEIRQQITHFHELQETIHNGEYFRLSNPYQQSYSAWEFLDSKRVIVQGLVYEKKPNSLPERIRLQGLDPNARYRLVSSGEIWSGTALMKGGLLIEHALQDNAPFEYILEKVSQNGS